MESTKKPQAQLLESEQRCEQEHDCSHIDVQKLSVLMTEIDKTVSAWWNKECEESEMCYIIGSVYQLVAFKVISLVTNERMNTTKDELQKIVALSAHIVKDHMQVRKMTQDEKATLNQIKH